MATSGHQSSIRVLVSEAQQSTRAVNLSIRTALLAYLGVAKYRISSSVMGYVW